jgi:hypothetical protein
MLLVLRARPGVTPPARVGDSPSPRRPLLRRTHPFSGDVRGPCGRSRTSVHDPLSRTTPPGTVPDITDPAKQEAPGSPSRIADGPHPALEGRSPGVTRIERIPTLGGDGPCVRTSPEPSSGALGPAGRSVGETRCRATPSPAEVQRRSTRTRSLGTRRGATCRAPCPLNPLPSSSPSTPSSAPPHGEVKTERQDPPPASSRDVQDPCRGGPGEARDTERFLEIRSAMEQDARAQPPRGGRAGRSTECLNRRGSPRRDRGATPHEKPLPRERCAGPRKDDAERRRNPRKLYGTRGRKA